MANRKTCLKEPRYVTSLAVWVGSAQALIEMCRYDSCYPASEDESRKIMRLISHEAEPSDHIVRLVRVARHDGPPTVDRWRSFNAFVLDVRHPQDAQLSDDELAKLATVDHGVRSRARAAQEKP